MLLELVDVLIKINNFISIYSGKKKDLFLKNK
jgi:hypothetical protein